MWKILLLIVALNSSAVAQQRGPIVWGNNNNALYLPTNRPTVGTECLTIDAKGNITPQICSSGGSGAQSFANISTNQTLVSSTTSYYVDVTLGDVSVTLPSAASNSGVVFEVMNDSFASVNNVNVLGTINGTVNEVLGAGENSVYKSNGIEWKKVAGGAVGSSGAAQTFANINSNQTLNVSVVNYYVDVTLGNINVTLPSAALNPGAGFEVMNDTFGSANIVTVLGTINGTVNEILTAGETSVYKSNGVEWKKKN